LELHSRIVTQRTGITEIYTLIPYYETIGPKNKPKTQNYTDDYITNA